MRAKCSIRKNSVAGCALLFEASIVATACGASALSTPAPSGAQLEMVQNRDLPTPPQVFREAVERVFAASRPGSYKLRFASSEIIAELHWRRLTVVGVERGSDLWDVRFWPKAGGTAASVQELGRYGGLVTIPLTPPNEVADYDLFWARIDYVLGRRAGWVTREAYRRSMVDPRAPQTVFRSLCGEGATDSLPTPLPHE